jgi:hypothetical protein
MIDDLIVFGLLVVIVLVTWFVARWVVDRDD